MRVCIALAVLSLGLGCAEGKEQWSPSARQVFVVGCLETSGNGLAGINPGDHCRCVLEVLESYYTETEFLLLGQVSAGNVSRAAARACYQAAIAS
jgi:hypothetical protein